VGGEPGDAQCVAKLATSTHPPDTHHQIGLALRCTHQRVDTPAAPEATLLQLSPTSAASFPLPLGWAFCWLQLLTRSRYLFAPWPPP